MHESLREHILQSLKAGMRLDGRKPLEYRKVTIETGVSRNAEGSAKVMIGDTHVICGVKMGVERPYPDTPDKGMLMVNAELTPLSNPQFEPGPPDIQAIELARVVDRGIREAQAIDVKELCITAGEKVWSVTIDVCSINASGNLLDAASIAAIAALRECKFPKYEDNTLDYKARTKKSLPLKFQPIAITVWKIGSYYIMDPTDEEEKVADARLSVAATEDGKLCAMQKGGDLPLTISDVSEMIDIAMQKAQEIRELL